MPDMQWHIDEDAEEETSVTVTEPRRSLRWLAILLAVILGVGLGIMYRSVPEPAPRPTSAPQPTPTRLAIPAKLFETIDREAQALADGDLATYLKVQPSSSSRTETPQENFTAWGRPKDDRPLYAIVDFDVWKEGRAWADIRQFREGRYFRETRFYYETDRWWRSVDPDRILWGDRKESVQTPHFNVLYASFDRDVISPTLHQLEEDYQALCGDLGCASVGHELTFTVNVDARYGLASYRGEGGESVIPLLSPRVTGFFESGRIYSWENNSATLWAIARVMAEQIYGPINFDQPGDIILWGSIVWAIDRHDPLVTELWSEWGGLKQQQALPLEEFWGPFTGEQAGLGMEQAYQLSRFVEQTYGPPAVAPLLLALRTAKSLPEAIENGLGVPFAEFDQKWQAWIKQNLSSQ